MKELKLPSEVPLNLWDDLNKREDLEGLVAKKEIINRLIKRKCAEEFEELKKLDRKEKAMRKDIELMEKVKKS